MKGAAIMDMETELFEDYSIEEIKQGFYEDARGYTCLICGERFEKGEIYRFSGKLYEGNKAIKLHIKREHHSVEEILLGMQANNLGISELQLQLLNFFAKGLSDKEIADDLGVTGSTIRNHRFKLRERERQNKVFIALMEILKQEGHISRGNVQVERNKDDGESTMVSDKERKRILDKYMTETGRLKCYPKYERSRRVVLEAILINFCTGRKYSDEEVNHILTSIYQDYKLLKRELIAYQYIDRTPTGAIYWVKDSSEVEYLDKIAK